MRYHKGFGVIEIIIASALIAGSLYALASVLLLAGSAIEISRRRLSASFLLEEGLEVVRHVRDAGWDANIGSLTAGQDYYLNFNSGTGSWNITSTAEPPIEGIFSRSFRLERVSRDISDGIESVYVPANEDPETRKVIFTIAWTFKNSPHTVTLESYITDMFNN